MCLHGCCSNEKCVAILDQRKKILSPLSQTNSTINSGDCISLLSSDYNESYKDNLLKIHPYTRKKSIELHQIIYCPIEEQMWSYESEQDLSLLNTSDYLFYSLNDEKCLLCNQIIDSLLINQLDNELFNEQLLIRVNNHYNQMKYECDKCIHNKKENNNIINSVTTCTDKNLSLSTINMINDIDIPTTLTTEFPSNILQININDKDDNNVLLSQTCEVSDDNTLLKNKKVIKKQKCLTEKLNCRLPTTHQSITLNVNGQPCNTCCTSTSYGLKWTEIEKENVSSDYYISDLGDISYDECVKKLDINQSKKSSTIKKDKCKCYCQVVHLMDKNSTKDNIPSYHRHFLPTSVVQQKTVFIVSPNQSPSVLSLSSTAAASSSTTTLCTSTLPDYSVNCLENSYTYSLNSNEISLDNFTDKLHTFCHQVVKQHPLNII
uniref:Uncharacterized protein n=1 Tax=Trichobilharzia regenti TaxID=157069 RepID=A0AA85JUW8_TRIRE|nr:unnamed protein product [Trichobilharzia regenti]